MRSTTKAKLDQAIRLQWFKRASIASGVALLIAGGLWYTGLDATVQNQRVKGTITGVTATSGITTQALEPGLTVSIKLDDGRETSVIVVKSDEPQTGQAVEITERIHGTGRSTFSWK